MTRICYDSTNPRDIPASARMVGYYVDGIYAVSQATVRARFPQAVLVPISAVGTNAGIVGDVEPGCMSVVGGVAWVKMRRLSGVDPTIYCNQMNAWAGVRQAFRNAGVAEPHYWVANYDRIQTIPAGAVAKQFTNPTYSGGHYDLSVVADFWPGIDGAAPSGIGSGADPGNLPGDDMTPAQEALLLRQNAFWFGSSDPTYKTYTDFGTAYRAKLDAILAGATKPEPPEVEPAPAPAITPQEAADLATIAGFLRKFGQ